MYRYQTLRNKKPQWERDFERQVLAENAVADNKQTQEDN